MREKPKRKRSERVNHSKRRFALLAVVYTLLVLPCLAKIGLLLPVLIAMSLGLGVLAIGGYLINLLGKLEDNLLTNTVIFLITAASASFAGILIVIPPIAGLLVLYIMFPVITSMFIFTLPVTLVLFFAYTLLSSAFTLELGLQIIALMDSFLPRAVPTEKPKNDYRSRLLDELEDADIPLELLAESESDKQKMK